MEVAYKRDLRHNYMVISETEDCQMDTYSINLLEREKIQGILPVEKRRMDQKVLFYYDITAKQPMEILLDKSCITCEQMLGLLEGIIHTLERAYEYLLPEDDFVLKPEFIYMTVTMHEPVLCYLPGYNKEIKEQMSRLIEYLMNKVDYNDKEAVLLIYQMYAISREEGYTFEHLKDGLKDKKTYSIPEKEKQISPNKLEAKDIGSHKMGERENASLESNPRREGRLDDIGDKTYLGHQSPLKHEENHKAIEFPVMMEKIAGEKEIYFYPMKIYLYTALSFIIFMGIFMLSSHYQIIYHPLGDRVDYSKLIPLVLILLSSEGYVLSKLWNKKNKITRVVEKEEYINPSEVWQHKGPKISLLEKGAKFLNINNQGMDNKGINQINGHQEIRTKGENDQGVNNKTQKPRDHGENHQGEINDNSIYLRPEVAHNIDNHGVNRYQGVERGNMKYTPYENKVLRENLPMNQFKSKEINISRDSSILTDKVIEVEYDLEDNPTCLLNATIEEGERDQPIGKKEGKLLLDPVDSIAYQKILIETLPFFIGKLKRNVNYSLKEDVVSRYHAKIIKEEEQFYLIDLNSTNGTFINGTPIGAYEKQPLQIGDEIAFAHIKYRFVEI